MNFNVKTLFPVLIAFSIPVFAISPEEAAVIATIENNAKVASAFPRTLDENSLLKLYAPDAIVISDGEFETTQERKEALAQVVELVNLGNNIGLSIRNSEIKVQILQPNLAWFTYDSVYKIAVAGTVVEEIANKCSGLYKKIASNWLIQHEHCSKVKPEKETSQETEGIKSSIPVEEGAVHLQ